MCSDFFDPWGRTIVDSPNIERTDILYDMQVVSSSNGELHLTASPLPEDTPHVDVEFPVVDEETLDLPSVGQDVVVQGGVCDSGTNSGYVRVTDSEGVLLWEGGSPFCANLNGWGAFRMEAMEGAEACLYDERPPLPPPECCCQTRKDQQVLLAVEQPQVPMAPGENRVITIDGRQYLAASQGGYETFDGPCTFDFAAVFGSAFLVRLAD